jgi:hypothetical protein
MPELVQIVPQLPPAISGVGDYSLLLASQLRRDFEVETCFVVGNPDWRGPAHVDGFRVCQVSERSSAALKVVLDRETILGQSIFLQYVGYGYEKRGCPGWLVDGITRWHRSNPGRLVTMFHELYGKGPVWSSSFWNSPVQRWLTMRLARESDRCRTNMHRSADELERMAPRHSGNVVVLPVFSSVGEMDSVQLLDQREPELVLFGGGRWLDEAASTHHAMLELACEVLGIIRIIAIGVLARIPLKFSVPVEETGPLSAERVSQRLGRARAGFIAHTPKAVGKSTIFAAYCAHGMLPMLIGSMGGESEGVYCGRHYVSADELAKRPTATAFQAIADNASAWYSAHSLRRTAASVFHQCALGAPGQLA